MSVLYYTVKAQGKTVYSAKYKQDAQLLSPAPSGAHSPSASTHHPQQLSIIRWSCVCIMWKKDDRKIHTNTTDNLLGSPPPPPHTDTPPMPLYTYTETQTFSFTHVHKHTSNQCPVRLNFPLPFFFAQLSLIFDVPCIALIMYLASVQTWRTPSSL